MVADLDPDTARRFHGGRPCLDFVHTGGVGRFVMFEMLNGPEDLDRWLAHVLGHDSVSALPRDLEPTRELRRALWDLAQARVAERELAASDVAIVNAAAAVATPAPRIAVAGSREEPVVTVPAALSELARDAIDLFTGPLGHRIRTCESPDCEFLFVDASRPGKRRWCSMERCGNRAKMRAYRARSGG